MASSDASFVVLVEKACTQHFIMDDVPVVCRDPDGSVPWSLDHVPLRMQGV